MDSVAGSRWARSAALRRTVLIGLILLFALLSLFPQRYRAAVTLTPTDPSSLGLSGTLGQLGAINSVFGTQAAVEIASKVGNSVYVRETAAQKLKLRERLHFSNDTEMYRWLRREVDISILRGGILQYETLLSDPDLARDIVAAYASATQDRLAQISRRQTEYKRDILIKLVEGASERLRAAQAAYDTFRLQNHYSEPQDAFYAMGSRVTTLEAAIKAKQVQLNAARQFATDSNMQVQQILAELGALQAQLSQLRATSPTQANSVGHIVSASTQSEKLERELKIAQTLYDSYMRFLQGTSVEDLTSGANVRLVEPAFIDTERQIDFRFASLALLFFVLLAAIEFYRFRPPVGSPVLVPQTNG